MAQGRDKHGRFTSSEGVEKASFTPKEIGETGLRRTSGFLDEEFLPALRGSERKSRVFREMRDNDPVVGAVLFAIEQLMRQATWDVKPAGEDLRDQEHADLLEGMLFQDMSHTWEDFVSEVFSMLPFGYAPMEIVWKKRGGSGPNPRTRSMFTDGLIAPRKISLRAQETVVRWKFDEDGGIQGVVQQPITGGMVTIPIEKMLLFRTSIHKNNPEGRSVLRNAYRPWYFKKRIEEIEGIGIERDLAGLPVVRVPGKLLSDQASADEKKAAQSYKDLVTNIRRDKKEGVVMPSDRDKDTGEYKYDLQLLSTGGSRQFETSKIIDRYDRRIATTVLADFIFLGQEKTGSFALSSDKTALFATALDAWLDMVAATINRHLVPRIWSLNGLPEETMPTLEHGDVEKPNIEELGKYVSNIAGAGAALFPNRDLENRLLELGNLPQMPDEDNEAVTSAPTDDADPDDEGDDDE